MPTVIPLDLSENQFQLYKKIACNYTHSFLFESLAGPEQLAEVSIMGFDPKIIFCGYADHVTIADNRRGTTQDISTNDPFAELRKLIYQNSVVVDGNSCDAIDPNNHRDEDTKLSPLSSKNITEKYRYLGGAVGAINYDFIRLVEDIPNSHISNNRDTPIMQFGIYDDGFLYDNAHKKMFYFYYDTNRFCKLKISDGTLEPFNASIITPNMDESSFSKIVQKAKQYIYDGDIFQVVLARKFKFETSGDSLQLYKTLRDLNPSPYMYHIKQDSKTVIGASPEMLLRITQNKTVETFPIAGTRKMTADATINKKLADELLADQKEIAEHTMLVDLGRNDIGRVCSSGSVVAKELMKIKQFSHVQHIVTHLAGILDPKHDMFDAFKAVFPAGTVSGAPKVRAMEIIDELESEPRDTYAGAVGYFAFNGCCDFAIAIRSIFLDGAHGYVQSGAGIVADSVAQNEFMETQHKADAMIQAIQEAAKTT